MKVKFQKISAQRSAIAPSYINAKNNTNHAGYMLFAPKGSDADTVTLVCKCNHHREHLVECKHRRAARELLNAEAMVEAEELEVCGDAYRTDEGDLLFAL